jgi:hypothetical protein
MFYVKLGERQDNLQGEPLAFSLLKSSINYILNLKVILKVISYLE